MNSCATADERQDAVGQGGGCSTTWLHNHARAWTGDVDKQGIWVSMCINMCTVLHIHGLGDLGMSLCAQIACTLSPTTIDPVPTEADSRAAM